MIAVVRDGKHEAAMVGRKTRLSQEQIEAVVDFIRAAFMPPEPGSPMARGRVIYMKMCVSCHGDRGQGAAARDARTASPPPLSRSHGGTDPTRGRVIAAIAREKHGASSAGFSTQLSAAEIQAVADYIGSAFITGGVDTAGSRATRD